MNLNSGEFFVALKGRDGFAYMEMVKPQDINLLVKKPIKFNKFNISYIGKELLERS